LRTIRDLRAISWPAAYELRLGMQEQWPTAAVFETLQPSRTIFVGMPNVFDEDNEGGATSAMLPVDY
jgi:hypothetical protein